MKLLILSAVAIILAVTDKNGCKKSQCLKGKIVAAKCMGTIVQITDGKFDASLVTSKWKDSLRAEAAEPAPELSNVFRLINPCKYALKEGDEIYFTIKTGEKEEGCASCMAYDLKPPSNSNAITICTEPKVK